MKLEKITSKSAKASRWYDDACGTAHALELVGERWSLLIVRELLLGPRRFGDLKSSLKGISANVLTQRLEGLEAAGVAARRKLPPPASVQVYELTAWGMEAEEAIKSLGRWAARSPDHDPTLPLSAVSFLLSMRTMFAADRAGDADLSIGFLIGEEAFRARIKDGRLTAERGEAEAPDAVVTASPEELAGFLYVGAPLPPGAVAGDAEALDRYAALFGLPDKACVV
jgi:DNA-binding HxlR family transcriptional regulator